MPNLEVNIRFQTIFLHLLLFSILFSQEALEKPRSFSPLTKKVFSFSKLDFVTAEGEFNEAICTLKISELVTDSPPFIAIYYRRENSLWFTESLYRKRLRFSFKDGVIKLDRSNFWEWFEIEEIKIVVIF